MIMTPYKPTVVSQTDIDVLNELILSKRLLGISADKGGRALRFLNSSDDSVAASAFSFSLEADAAKIEITLELGVESSLTERLKEVGGIDSVPEEFKTSMMAFCSGEIIDSLEHLLKLPVTLWDESKKNTPSIDTKKLFFEVLSADLVREAHGNIILPLTLLRRVLVFAKDIPSIEKKSLSQVLLDGELIIGEATLSIDQWDKIIPGDLIFLEEPSTLATGKGKFLLKKGAMLPVLFDATQFQPLILSLEEIFPKGFQPKRDATKEDVSSQKEAYSIELKMSAGSLALTIDELLHLAATQAIDQQIKVCRPLEILTQEKSLGSGELVKISDRYAIVITQLKK